MSELIKAKISFTTDIVVENVYGEDPEKAVRSAWAAHKDEIMSQASETDTVKVKVGKVKSLKDLPPKWDARCLPWLPGIPFGSSKQERIIGEFFK
jgi:hypothetical protein